MKLKTTRKEIIRQNTKAELIRVGYCELQNLLRGVDPVAYTCGVYGWNFDVYRVYGRTICTGYRGMPGRDAKNAGAYDLRARAIWDDWKTPYEKKAEKVAALLREFCLQA